MMCTPLNFNIQPEGPKDCGDRCRFACGYGLPTFLIILIFAIYFGCMACFVQIIYDHRDSIWRIVVCAIFIIICSALLIIWGYTYYKILMTGPGYVPYAVWKYPPQVASTTDVRRSMAEEDEDDEQVEINTGDPDKHVESDRLLDAPSPANGIQHAASSHTRESDINHDPTARPPDSSAPNQNPHTVRTVGNRGSLRFCNYCQMYKPDHAFHCKYCGKCVYRFDHHCPWINNCVGRNNYKLFICFLVNSSICLFLVGALILAALFGLDYDSVGLNFKTWYRIGVASFAFLLCVCLLMFAVQFMFLYRRGMSTVESFISNQNRGTDKQPQSSNSGLSGGVSCGDSCDNAVCPVYPYPESPEEQKDRILQHQAIMLGRPEERKWYSIFIPKPVRTDNGADEDYFSGDSKRSHRV